MIYLPELGSILEEASDKKSYVPEVHRFLRDEADTVIYLPNLDDILKEASDIKIHTLDAAPSQSFLFKGRRENMESKVYYCKMTSQKPVLSQNFM